MTHADLVASGLHECADDCKQTNEAAERLRDKLIEHAPAPMVDRYEEAVRRATVERIRARLERIEEALPGTSFRGVYGILDEEAARG